MKTFEKVEEDVGLGLTKNVKVRCAALRFVPQSMADGEALQRTVGREATATGSGNLGSLMAARGMFPPGSAACCLLPLLPACSHYFLPAPTAYFPTTKFRSIAPVSIAPQPVRVLCPPAHPCPLPLCPRPSQVIGANKAGREKELKDKNLVKDVGFRIQVRALAGFVLVRFAGWLGTVQHKPARRPPPAPRRCRPGPLSPSLTLLSPLSPPCFLAVRDRVPRWPWRGPRARPWRPWRPRRGPWPW